MPSKSEKVSIPITNGDLFFELYSRHQSPVEGTNNKQVISNWVKMKILKKISLDCNEDKWLRDFANYFDENSKRIWNKNGGNIKGPEIKKKHGIFFDRIISTKGVLSCKCKTRATSLQPFKCSGSAT